MIVRCVTLFVTVKDWRSKDSIKREIESRVSGAVDVVKGIAHDHGIDVESVRLALPPTPAGVSPLAVAEACVEAVDELGFDICAAIHGYPTSVDDVKRVVSAVDGFEKIYASFIMRDTNDCVTIAKALASAPTETLTRISAATSFEIYTPYFPSSVNYRNINGVAVAIRYATDLYDAIRSGADPVETLAQIFDKVDRFGRAVAKKLDFEYLGTDPSLSPWGEDSVARVIEYLAKAVVPAPATFWAVTEIEKYIEEASKKADIDKTGFSQVMLPLAEDKVLIERARRWMLRGRDFLAYAAYCVAGFDMVVLPRTLPERDLAGIYMAVLAASRVKNKQLAARVVLADAEAGETITLREFGEVPVIEL